ncbi:uncharacterized protein N7518_003786 [Penicillium psychrosexuale]|uniref:uncharacterized protein n=1 Tax=Penicillium psychrosexuale TaxID=1002107 RepID=UPI0025459EA7|nr:uncharacterized protein N7518_003786 [Penicillium psychrosexuale]KAJ5801718.1 hypothetical protein N7518_003786 [Penicillium psychrosexuale]
MAREDDEMRNMDLWVNLATKVKLWFDSVTAKGKHSAIAHGKWHIVLRYWQEITKNESVSGATRELFAELPPRVAGVKRKAEPAAPPLKTFFRGTPIHEAADS